MGWSSSGPSRPGSGGGDNILHHPARSIHVINDIDSHPTGEWAQDELVTAATGIGTEPSYTVPAWAEIASDRARVIDGDEELAPASLPEPRAGVPLP
jgi:hypothetical protein